MPRRNNTPASVDIPQSTSELLEQLDQALSRGRQDNNIQLNVSAPLTYTIPSFITEAETEEQRIQRIINNANLIWSDSRNWRNTGINNFQGVDAANEIVTNREHTFFNTIVEEKQHYEIPIEEFNYYKHFGTLVKE